MSVLLSSVVGGGGSFKTESRVVGQIAAGVTGDILTINHPGKVIRLYALGCNSTTVQTGISLDRDGFLLADQLNLIDTTPTGSGTTTFGVMRGGLAGSAERNAIFFDTIEGETITISKNAGNTTQIIDYAYEVGTY